MIVPLTTKGAARLREELENLKSVKRPAVIHAIAEARAHGDLKENAEYHAARERACRGGGQGLAFESPPLGQQQDHRASRIRRRSGPR